MKKRFRVRVGDRTFEVEVEEIKGEVEETRPLQRRKRAEEPRQVKSPARVETGTERRRVQAEEGGVPAPLSGTVLSTSVNVGDEVNSGDLLLILEAMKMENEIYSPLSGKVKRIVDEGREVQYGEILVEIE
jgi:biotin carboxyl carrier protein